MVTELASLAMERSVFRIEVSPAPWSETGADAAARDVARATVERLAVRPERHYGFVRVASMVTNWGGLYAGTLAFGALSF